ncbi:MAG: hypothetical protein R3B70_30610 [Polyangiaceae bacterium]
MSALRDPEVREAGEAIHTHEQVLRGDIPVHDLERMAGRVFQIVRGGEPRTGIERDADGEAGRQRLGRVRGEQLREARSLDVVHDEEQVIGRLLHVEDGHDIGVVNARGEARFFPSPSGVRGPS